MHCSIQINANFNHSLLFCIIGAVDIIYMQHKEAIQRKYQSYIPNLVYLEPIKWSNGKLIEYR